jgi:hypothetical protein
MRYAMHRTQRRNALRTLSGALLFGSLVTAGCSGEQTKTGTLVERTPEQIAAEKASMEGMRNAMMKVQSQRQGQAK